VSRHPEYAASSWKIPFPAETESWSLIILRGSTRFGKGGGGGGGAIPTFAGTFKKIARYLYKGTERLLNYRISDRVFSKVYY